MRKMWTDAGELSKLTWEEALEGAKSLNEIGKETAEALRNVPSGFKVALARFDATKAVNMAGSEVGTTDLKQIIVSYYGDSYGFDDFKRTITDIVRDASGNSSTHRIRILGGGHLFASFDGIEIPNIASVDTTFEEVGDSDRTAGGFLRKT